MTIIDDAIDLFVEQFKGAEVIENLARALVTGLNDTEGVLNDLLLKRWLALAEGIQLDRLGVILGQPRYGRDDESYRTALYFQIFINTSKADPEAIIKATRVLSDGDFIRYWENYPAGYQIFTNGPNVLDISGAVLLTFNIKLDDGGLLELDDDGLYLSRSALDVPQELVLFLKFLSPTAIDYISLIFSLGETPLFGVFEFISAYLVLDDGGELELSDGSMLEVFSTEVATSPDGFLGFAELILTTLELDDGGELYISNSMYDTAYLELDDGGFLESSNEELFLIQVDEVVSDPGPLAIFFNDQDSSGGKLAEVMVDEFVN